MSKVIIVSRHFPAYHPRKGEPTNFVRSIWEGLDMLNWNYDEWDERLEEDAKSYFEKKTYTPKWHTIRAGERWKVGDMASLRVWSGKPYRSKQIEIAPPVEIKRIWPIEISNRGDIHISDYLWQRPYDELATNDGLSNQDFIDWLIKPATKKHFKGQIISWTDSIEYNFKTQPA